MNSLPKGYGKNNYHHGRRVTKTYDQVYGEKIEASQIVFKTRREAEEALKNKSQALILPPLQK